MCPLLCHCRRHEKSNLKRNFLNSEFSFWQINFRANFNVFLQLFLQTNYQSKKKHTMQSAPTWTWHSPKWLDFKKKKTKLVENSSFPMSKFYFIHKSLPAHKNLYTHIDKFTNNLFHFLKRVLLFWKGNFVFQTLWSNFWSDFFLTRKLPWAFFSFLEIAATHLTVTKTEHFLLHKHPHTDRQTHMQKCTNN